MSGLQRVVRHPDRRSDVHARARGLASDKLLAPLSAEEAAWLRAHLDACAACRRAADGFSSDRARMRALGAELPVPPRDMGARLSRALDVEVRRAVREEARPGGRSVLGSPSVALAVIALAAVLAIVFLPLTLPGFRFGNGPTVAGPGGSPAPLPTPIIVATQAVAWVQQQPDGSYVLNTTTVSQVCPGVDASACGTLAGNARPLVALNLQPSAVVLQHSGPSAVLGQQQRGVRVQRSVRGPRHTDARSFVFHPNTRGTFPDAGGDGGGSYSSSSHSRPDRFPQPASHPYPPPGVPHARGVGACGVDADHRVGHAGPDGRTVRRGRGHGARVRGADAVGLAREHPAREPGPLGGHHDAHHRRRRAGRPASCLLDGRTVGRLLGTTAGRHAGPGHLRLARRRCEGAAAHDGSCLGLLLLGRRPDPGEHRPSRR